MACPSLPALPVAQQQVMSPSAQEVAAAMAGTGTGFYGATGDGSVASTSVANGTTAAPGLFVSNNPNSVITHEVAQRANNPVDQATGIAGTTQPDMVMPRRHPDLADAERLTSEISRQNPDEAFQPVSHVAASPNFTQPLLRTLRSFICREFKG